MTFSARRRRLAIALTTASMAGLAGCGPAAPPTPALTPAAAVPGTLIVSPQNDEYTSGRNRLSIALDDASQQPVLNATATVEVRTNPTVAARPVALSFVGPAYPQLPIYTGVVEIPRTGSVLLVVHAQLSGGGTNAGQAYVTVHATSGELGVGQRMPAVVQPVVGPGVPVSDINSGIPPDPWHDTTIAAGLAGHRPMLVYVGEPGRCSTHTCGDTIAVLETACTTLCGSLIFEHIEVHNPADSNAYSPGWLPFHLEQEQPWIYLINSQGTIADAFEGPAPLAQVAAAAAGTLAGHVPAV